MAIQRCGGKREYQCVLDMYHEGSHVFNIDERPEKVYFCPKCFRPGFPSIYGDYCTNCSNVIRGFY